MQPYEIFKRTFSEKSLREIYQEKIKYRANVGMDRITPTNFDANLDENIKIISRKVLDGTYRFTRYRQVLISKGKNKPPRVISIPTIRDKLALAAYHRFLRDSFAEVVEEPLLHTIIGGISHDIASGKFESYVKADISSFYASLDHDILLKKIKKRVRKKEAIRVLTNAIRTETVDRNISSGEQGRKLEGVPEGLSISNILADIYLNDLEERIRREYDVPFYRYVDDILILCSAEQAKQIKKLVAQVLSEEYHLKTSDEKTCSGALIEGIPFLGYVFSSNGIRVREAAIKKIEKSIEDLFRKRKKGAIKEPLFMFRLNLKITGCILERKKYGWLFYYSQLTDLSVLYHLDWYVDKMFKRFKMEKPSDLKLFVRTYHEITKNLNWSTYLMNEQFLSLEQKKNILSELMSDLSMDEKSAFEIDELFKEAMFKEVETLEKDIQNFS